MASNPYPDHRRGTWKIKWKPDPNGEWKAKTLGSDPRLKTSRPPTKPPQFIIDRAREFAELEYRALNGLGKAPVRAKGLEDYLDGYIEAFEKTHKPGSVKQLRRHVAMFKAFAASQNIVSVQAVTKAVCRDYLEFRAGAVSHDTLKTEMRCLSPIWTRAVEDELLALNPWSRLKIPGKSTRSDPVFWTSEEVAAIAGNCSKPWQSDLVLVLANTGLRISTALSMRWEWINWTLGWIIIPKEAAAETDGVKTSYDAPLNRVSRDVLQRRHVRSASPLVFPNPYKGGGQISYATARAAIADAIRKAGVKTGTPHDLRHTFGRALDRSGKPASIVSALMGHTNLRTTQIYTNATMEEAARHLEDFGIGDVPPTPPPPPGDPDPDRLPA